jgi:hypothetical protein
MDQATPSAPTPPMTDLCTDRFEPPENVVRGRVRAFIEGSWRSSSAGGRYARGHAAKGHRNGDCERRLDTRFWPLVPAVPRAWLADDDAGERKWKSELLLAYRHPGRPPSC